MAASVKWEGSPRFVLRWDLDESDVEGAGFDVDDARASATYDFSTGEVLEVDVHSEIVERGLAVPYLEGPKSTAPAASPMGESVWAAHGRNLEPTAVRDRAWFEGRGLAVEVFGDIVRRISARLPEILADGLNKG